MRELEALGHLTIVRKMEELLKIKDKPKKVLLVKIAYELVKSESILENSPTWRGLLK